MADGRKSKRRTGAAAPPKPAAERRSGSILLSTERLILRTPTLRDAAGILDFLRRNHDFHAPHPPRPPDFHTEAFWRKEIPRLARNLRADRGARVYLFGKDDPGRIVGHASLSMVFRGPLQAATLGYGLDRSAEGRGLMTEALREFLRWSFEEFHLHRIGANHRPANKRSAAVLKRLGFRREGIAKDYLYMDGRWHDHVLTSLTNRNWKPAP